MLKIILFLSIMFSCEGDDSFNEQLNKIDFEILTIDEEQTEKNVFGSGTDIIIALQLTNNSNKVFEWKYDYTCELFQADEFLVVYKKNHDNETTENHIQIGTPYQPPINCQTINLPPQKIQDGDNIQIVKLPWSSNPDNQTLSSGNYFIKANIGININGRYKNWNLITDFDVE